MHWPWVRAERRYDQRNSSRLCAAGAVVIGARHGQQFYDNNLMQEVDVDTHFSETHTGIERPQPIGLTAVPLKQEEEQGGQQQQSRKADDEFQLLSSQRARQPSRLLDMSRETIVILL